MFDAAGAQRRLADRGLAIEVDGDFGAKSYAVLLAWVAGKPAPTPLMLDLGRACARYFPENGIDTALRIAHNLAQACAETGRFTTMTESLNYSVQGLLDTFGTRRISPGDAQRLGRKPGEPALSANRQAAIANIVYGGAFGRLNLGNRDPGDGAIFIGRGWKQTTGRANYGDVERSTGLGVLANPKLLALPDNGVRAGCVFWTSKDCNKFADADDIDGLTRRVNGGLNGIGLRRTALARARQILN